MASSFVCVCCGMVYNFVCLDDFNYLLRRNIHTHHKLRATQPNTNKTALLLATPHTHILIAHTHAELTHLVRARDRRDESTRTHGGCR